MTPVAAEIRGGDTPKGAARITIFAARLQFRSLPTDLTADSRRETPNSRCNEYIARASNQL
jgi:hypothetical protein